MPVDFLSSLSGNIISRLANTFDQPPPPIEPYNVGNKEEELDEENREKKVKSDEKRNENKVVKWDIKKRENDTLEIYDKLKTVENFLENLPQKVTHSIMEIKVSCLIEKLPLGINLFFLRPLFETFGNLETYEHIRNLKSNPFNFQFLLLEYSNPISINILERILKEIVISEIHSEIEKEIEMEIKVPNKTKEILKDIENKFKIDELKFETSKKFINSNLLNIYKDIINLEFDKTFSELFDDKNSFEKKKENTFCFLYEIQKRIENINELLYSNFSNYKMKSKFERIFTNRRLNLISRNNERIFSINENRNITNKMLLPRKYFKSNLNIIPSYRTKINLIDLAIEKIPFNKYFTFNENVDLVFDYRFDFDYIEREKVLDLRIKFWVRNCLYNSFGNEIEKIVFDIISFIKRNSNPFDLCNFCVKWFERDAKYFVYCLWRRIIFEENFGNLLHKYL